MEKRKLTLKKLFAGKFREYSIEYEEFYSKFKVSEEFKKYKREQVNLFDRLRVFVAIDKKSGGLGSICDDSLELLRLCDCIYAEICKEGII